MEEEPLIKTDGRYIYHSIHEGTIKLHFGSPLIALEKDRTIERRGLVRMVETRNFKALTSGVLAMRIRVNVWQT